jgi:hypothetical protein
VFSFFLADLDSVGRRCATRLHKLGPRYAIPLKTNADDNGRIGAPGDSLVRRLSERELFGYCSVSGFCFEKKRGRYLEPSKNCKR